MTGRPVAYKTFKEKPYASVKSACQGRSKDEQIEWSSALHMSPATVHHLEAVFSIVRWIYGRDHDDPMNVLDVNVAIWCIFMNATLRAAVHLGQDYEMNLRYVKNNLWNSVGQLFRETGKLISDLNEITGFRTIDSQDVTWMSTSLLCERACQLTHAKTYVFSDSVLCVGKTGDDPIATWKSKIKCYSENNHFKDMNRIDGMPTEFEWKIFQGITALGLLEKIQNLMRDLRCEPEHFKGRIIFMSMHNDVAWQEKGNKERCEYNSQTVANYVRKFPRGHWSFLGPGCDEVPKRIRAPMKPAATEHLEKVEIPTVLFKAEHSTNAQQWRNLRQECERKFEQLPEDQKLTKLCSDAGLKLVEREQYFYTFETEEGQQMQQLRRDCTLPRK